MNSFLIINFKIREIKMKYNQLLIILYYIQILDIFEIIFFSNSI